MVNVLLVLDFTNNFKNQSISFNKICVSVGVGVGVLVRTSELCKFTLKGGRFRLSQVSENLNSLREYYKLKSDYLVIQSIHHARKTRDFLPFGLQFVHGVVFDGKDLSQLLSVVPVRGCIPGSTMVSW